jgi:hypothetical protein
MTISCYAVGEVVQYRCTWAMEFGGLYARGGIYDIPFSINKTVRNEDECTPYGVGTSGAR